MEDVQNSPAQVAMPIDRVGLKNLSLPILVKDRAQGHQHTIATVDIGVDLPAHFKGTHMSRFVEVLETWNEKLDYASFKTLLETIKERLEARKAFILFRFPYFIRKQAPATKSPGLVCYQCSLTGELGEALGNADASPSSSPESSAKPSFLLEVTVPVMTVCPCSKAISDEGAHSQRAEVHIAVRMSGFSWLEDFIDLAELSGSSPVYTVLKREDEKYVTEHAFAEPTFVEDVVRNVAQRIEQHGQVSWYKVEVESFESIHCHNAFACIERTL